ncbi:MAG: hypothetical protein RR893_03365 [Clostridia bacterium]
MDKKGSDRMTQLSGKEIHYQLLEAVGVEHLAEQLSPLPENCFDVSPNNPLLKNNYVMLYPKTLEELRRAVGVPLEVSLKSKDAQKLPPSVMQAKELALTAKTSKDPAMLYELAKELLLFPNEETELLLEQNDAYKQALAYMLKKAEVLPVLLATNLEVQDGQTYTITNTAVAIFGSIIVHPKGSIVLGCNVKVVADSITQM